MDRVLSTSPRSPPICGDGGNACSLTYEDEERFQAEAVPLVTSDLSYAGEVGGLMVLAFPVVLQNVFG